MMQWILWVLTALIGPVSIASSEHLVLAVSEDDIAVTANFSGASIALLGSIERDRQTAARRAGYDVVVVLLGPRETLVTRRRERVGGIWMNRDSIHYPNVPSLYRLAGNRPLVLIAGDTVLDKKEIGLDHLKLQTLEALDQATAQSFRSATLRLKQSQGLYAENAGEVEFLSATLFRAKLSLPANIKTGRYEALVYLFADGAFLAEEKAIFYVGKTGIEAAISQLSWRQPFLYGVIAVLVALLTGWIGGVMFRRD